ncbi:Hypothetical_protein [Hexamita inflata]|uniref:Hypothetical_protein n=1 Tax=Hexamita inflata TaxID=28002 RepID=A0AA86U9C7_9EUKA|nr:Hypothetical protein HINF_LOCUS33944 [Hexamita inflata]
MVKALISKMVTRQLSSQISLNSKSSILPSISDLNGSYQNSSLVTFQGVSEMIYLSTISKSENIFSLDRCYIFLRPTVMVKRLSLKWQLDNYLLKSHSIVNRVYWFALRPLGFKWKVTKNSSVMTFQGVSGNEIYLSQYLKSKTSLSRIGVISFCGLLSW